MMIVLGGGLILLGFLVFVWCGVRKYIFETDEQFKDYGESRSGKILQKVWLAIAIILICLGGVSIFLEL